MEILKNFLLLVGAFLVALVAFVFLIYLWLRYKFRSWIKSFEDAALLSPTIPPFRVHLQRADEPEWQRLEEVDSLAAALEEAGFQRSGDFQSDDLPGIVLRALTHPEHRVDAVIYDYALAGVWFDLVCRYADGRNLTFTSAAPTGLASPPFLTIEHHPGAEPQELLEHCLTTRPKGDLAPTPAGEFPSRFEAAHAREMDWRADRGGPSDEEIRAIAAKEGKEATPEMIEQVHAMWRSRLNYEISEELRNVYLEQTRLSAREWEDVREGLYFVHDRLAESDLLEQCEMAWAQELADLQESADDDEDEENDRYEQEMERRRESLRSKIRGLSPRAAFIKINETLPGNRQFQKLGELTQPRPADVYLNPWNDEDGSRRAPALPGPQAESS